MASFQLVSTNVCSDRNREDNASGRLKGGEPFPSISHKVFCVPAFTIRCCFLSSFLFLSSFYGIFLTDERFFLFPAILVAQLLMGAMGNTPPIWVWCLGTFSAVILSCWILYSVWGPGPPRKDYTPAFLCFLCAYLRYALQDPLFA